MSNETSQISLKTSTRGICLCTSTPTVVQLPEDPALRYTIWVLGDEQYLKEVNGLSWKMWLFKKTNKRNHAVWHSLTLFSQDYQVSCCRWGGSIHFTTWTALLSGGKTKASAWADELACKAPTRETIWKSFWPLDSAYESPSLYQFPKSHTGHTLGATLRFDQQCVGFILWHTCSSIRDYASTRVVTTALFWCVAMEF